MSLGGGKTYIKQILLKTWMLQRHLLNLFFNREMADDQFGILILLGSYAIWNTMLTLIIIVKKVIVCIYLCGGGKMAG